VLNVHARLGKYLTRLGLEDFYRENLRDVSGVMLEIGAGTQNLDYGNGAKIVRLDISKSEHVDVVADAHDLPLANDSFDAILCKQVLEHLYHPHKAVDEMLRVLKPGGRAVASTCFYWPIHGAPVDYFRFTQFGLEKLFEKFSEVEVVPQNGLLGTLGIHLVRLAGGRRLAIKLLYPFIMGLAYILIKTDGLFKSTSKVKCITSGYNITAVKPGLIA